MTNGELKTRVGQFGSQVRQVRRALGLSQRELARRSRVGHRFISELELGKENPSLATIALLADGLGCDLWVLFQPKPR